jgi:hypothetical protein
MIRLRRRLMAGSLAALLTFTAAALMATPARAATCAVPSTSYPTLTDALADPTCNPINLASGTYSADGGGASGFTVTRSVTIDGIRPSLTTLTRSDVGNILTVGGGGALNLTDVGITGAPSGSGLSVELTGTATLTDVVVSDNSTNGSGGGIAYSSSGALNVTLSTLSGNSATDAGGGGINSGAGTATFNGVAFVNNTSGGGGGGWDNGSTAGTTNLKSVTFAGNRADGDGGAVNNHFAGDVINLNNVTIAGNFADDDDNGSGDGGGIANSLGATNIGNSIVANNTDRDNAAPDCLAPGGSPINLVGYELIRNLTGCNTTGSTVGQLPAGTDPMLAPLADNNGELLVDSGSGGPTMALLLGSPAVNAGNPTLPNTGNDGRCEPMDQRGLGRPLGSRCDIGAFEVARPHCYTIEVTYIGILAGQPVNLGLGCSGDPFVHEIVTPPSHGVITNFNSAARTLTYTPNANFVGLDFFTYRGTNGGGSSNISRVNIPVIGFSGPFGPPFGQPPKVRKCKKKKTKKMGSARAANKRKKCKRNR